MAQVPPKEPQPSYIIASSQHQDELREQVEALIAKGYACQGGIAISPGQWFYQAMVLREPRAYIERRYGGVIG